MAKGMLGHPKFESIDDSGEAQAIEEENGSGPGHLSKKDGDAVKEEEKSSVLAAEGEAADLATPSGGPISTIEPYSGYAGASEKESTAKHSNMQSFMFSNQLISQGTQEN